MKTTIKWLLAIIACTTLNQIKAQGPPITADKPIMLGAKSVILRTLTEVRNTEKGVFTKAPLMVHYLPTSNSLVAVHLPYVYYDFREENATDGQTLGDIEIMGKYQFYRNDKTGKTFRLVAKTLQTLPTGKSLNVDGISTGLYQSYIGTVAGYESIKYGISNELGYNIVPNGSIDDLRYKLGFGLPLLKPTYPVKQINLYFEYQSSWFIERGDYQLLYAQGVQYAKGRLTMEAAIQLPLAQTVSKDNERNYSLLFGTRFVF